MRTAITTATNCMIDLCLMFFIYEIARYRQILINNNKTAVDRITIERNILIVISIFVDISKVYTDVTHLNGY